MREQAEPRLDCNVNLGPAAVSDDGVIVAVRGGWNTWYDAQKFYRSEDGVTWEELAKGSFTGSHPITAMTFGWGAPSAKCGGS